MQACVFSVTKLDRFTCSQLLSLKPEVESSRAPRTVKQAWPREWASDMEQVKRGAKGRVWGRVVGLGGRGGGRRRLWRRSTPQQAFNQYPATTLIINNNINTLQLTLICNRGTPLHGARANPRLVQTPPRSSAPFNGPNSPWASDRWLLFTSIGFTYVYLHVNILLDVIFFTTNVFLFKIKLWVRLFCPQMYRYRLLLILTLYCIK